MTPDFDLGAATDILVSLIADIEEYVDTHEYVSFDLPTALTIRALMGDAARGLKACKEKYEDTIGDQMGEYRVVVPNHGQIERHRKTDRKQWDTAMLLHDVLDTKIVDSETGEVKDETQLEKVLQVWNLGPPRTTALKERGLDADDYCRVEVRPGYTIRSY